MNWGDEILVRLAFIPERYAEAVGQSSFGIQDVLDLTVPFFGYVFVHGDFTHVGVNCLWLLAFGPVVARRLTPAMFLLFFFLCGIAAVLTHLAVYWGDAMPVVGASGAVAGLMGAGIRIYYGGMFGKSLAPLTSRPIVGFSVLWVLGNVISGILRLGVTDGISVVAWVAHLGGYFAGLLAITWFDRQSAPSPRLRRVK